MFNIIIFFINIKKIINNQLIQLIMKIKKNINYNIFI